MTAPYSAFGKTRNVRVLVYQNGKRIESPSWDVEVWVDRDDALVETLNTVEKDKMVRIVRRIDWFLADRRFGIFD
jgi:hypothetical protein